MSGTDTDPPMCRPSVRKSRFSYLSSLLRTMRMRHILYHWLPDHIRGRIRVYKTFLGTILHYEIYPFVSWRFEYKSLQIMQCNFIKLIYADITSGYFPFTHSAFYPILRLFVGCSCIEASTIVKRTVRLADLRSLDLVYTSMIDFHTSPPFLSLRNSSISSMIH